ncbi:MAG: helix-turn-helix transcriptional regulator [Lachnospiraceae bacterium]|nr:helix-turn-helix transcriptional regulator [Lachnospiraceae bacterium]
MKRDGSYFSSFENQDPSPLFISEPCGFSTGSYFSKSFGKIMGCTPLEYRKKNRKSIV